MGLLNKFKDLFTEPDDTEEDEVKVEQIKKEPPKVHQEVKKVEHRRERIVEKEEKKEKKEDVKEPVVHETPTREKTRTPVFFTENDFADLEPEKPKKLERTAELETRSSMKKEEKKQPYGGHYSGTYTSTSILTKEKPTFKPTPIISPIYGILDKNYSKEDIVERKEVPTQSADGMTYDKFDEIRNKAYGTLEGDLAETIYDDSNRHPHSDSEKVEEEIDLFDELEQQDNHAKKKISLEDTTELAKTVTEQEKNIRELEEITMDLTKELDNLLLKKETFDSKKEEIERKQQEADDNSDLLTENEFFNFIDSKYEDRKG